jgi:hypothetical protein
MELFVSEKLIETVCNSLRASKQSLRSQLSRTTEESKKEILESQLAEVEEALSIFDQVQ